MKFTDINRSSSYVSPVFRHIKANGFDGITFHLCSTHEMLDNDTISLIRISQFCSVIYIHDYDMYFLLNPDTHDDLLPFIRNLVPDLAITEYLDIVRQVMITFNSYLPDLTPEVMVYDL